LFSILLHASWSLTNTTSSTRSWDLHASTFTPNPGFFFSQMRK
jgi:hypothetical protein